MATPQQMAVQELARRELARRKEAQGANDFGAAGPVAMGGQYLKRGLTAKDAPYVASKMGSEFVGGIPEMAAKKPMISSMAGPFGAVAGEDEGVNLFPEPASEGGRMMGRDLGLAAGMLDPALAVSGAKGLIAKPVQKFGVRVMQGILKPKGDLLEKGAQVAETALKENIVGSKENMLQKVYGLLQEGGKDIGEILKRNKGKKIDMNIVFGELKDLREKYAFAQNQKKVDVIDNLVEQFRPAFKEKKNVSFMKDVGGEFDVNTGDYVPNTQKIKRVQTVNRPVPVEEAQARKVAQYQDLAEGRGFPGEVTSPEVMGRKAYARGFKKATESVIPEVAAKNKRFGALADVSQSLEEVLPSEQKKQLLNLGDIILGSEGLVNPASMTAGVLRKTMQTTPITSRFARGAYRFGRNAPSSSMAYPIARYLTEENQ